jgi:hypothetical protein
VLYLCHALKQAPAHCYLPSTSSIALNSLSKARISRSTELV